MKELEAQFKFSQMLARLLMKAKELGYEVTLGEAWRPAWVAEVYYKQGKGTMQSFHIRRLAIDINLFKDGKWLDKTEDYEPLGVWWESIGGTWGGRFKRKDGVHFSFLE